MTDVWPTAPEGWEVSRPSYHKHPLHVEYIGGKWHLRRKLDNTFAFYTVSEHDTPEAAMAADPEVKPWEA